MKLTTMVAVAVLFGGIAALPVTGALADPAGPFEQPGADVAATQTSCSGAGAFGWFGNFGEVDNVHDVGNGVGYDQFADGTDDNVGQGAEGGVPGGTGDRNSNSCGSPQNNLW